MVLSRGVRARTATWRTPLRADGGGRAELDLRKTQEDACYDGRWILTDHVPSSGVKGFPLELKLPG